MTENQEPSQENTNSLPPEPPKEWAIRPGFVDYEDPLLTCLTIITTILQRPVSRQALKAGLPNADTQFTPELCVRAAERAGFNAKIVKRQDLSKVSQLTKPCILLLKNMNAVVLLRIDRLKGLAQIAVPEANGGKTVVKLKDLIEDYTGFAIFIKAKFQFDSRASYDESRYNENWFWGTLKRFMPIYRHVLLATLLLNLFGLATPLFTMNVYDRVVPNAAMDTLWVLASGVTIVFIIEFILRNLRSYFVDVAGKNADIIIASNLLEKVLSMRMDKKPESTGSMANNLKEFESLRDFFTSGTFVLIVDLPFIFIFIGVMFLIAGPLALIPLLAVPLVVITSWLMQTPFLESSDTFVCPAHGEAPSVNCRRLK